MFIIKESQYIFLRVLLTFIFAPTTVFSVYRPTFKLPWYRAVATSSPVCEERQCRLRSKEILESLDEMVDPCTNFYQYACGGWQKNNPIPPTQVLWNMETKFDHNMYLRMRETLEKPITTKDSNNLRKSKLHYQTCSYLSSLSKLEIDKLRTIVNEAGPWPMVDIDKDKDRRKKSVINWPEIHDHYFKLNSDGGLFDVDVSVDTQDLNKPVLELKAPNSPFGLVIRDGIWKLDWVKKYQQFLASLILKVVEGRSRVTEKSLMPHIKDVYVFRRRLEDCVSSEVLNSESYHPIGIKNFQYWFDYKIGLNESVRKINWLKTLNFAFYKSSVLLLTTNTRINVKHKEYFNAMATVIGRTPPEVIANHLHMYFVERYLLLDSELKNTLFKLITRQGVNIGSIRPLNERWERCISKSKLRVAIDELYLSKFVSDKGQKDVYEVSNEMRDIIKIHVNNSRWLNFESKRKAIARINDVKISIGFTKAYFNVKSQNKYGTIVNVNRVHAFYSVDINRVFIGANYFQSPMYMEDLPYVVTYASMGSLFGHELYHMFDKIGTSYAIFPLDKCQTLWTPDIMKIYNEKAKCVEIQFNKPVKELQDLPRNLPNDGVRTYNENLADVMSIRASYDAYKRRLIAEHGNCPTLPYLNNFDCEKLFFVSYAMTFCANIPQWKLVRQVQNNLHSVPELRVNIPVGNMPEFSQAFQCKSNSYEASVKKCYIWD